MIETVRDGITWVFIYLLYPACILGMFIVLFAMLMRTIGTGQSDFAKFRRSIGAILPFVSLILLVASGDKFAATVDSQFSAISWYFRFFIGLFLGGVLFEAMMRFEVENDVVAALFAFLLSSIASFAMWLFISEIFDSFNLLFLGFLLGGGFHFIFRGREDMWGDNNAG